MCYYCILKSLIDYKKVFKKKFTSKITLISIAQHFTQYHKQRLTTL